MVEKKEIAQLVDRLDHPAAEDRREAMNRLVELGDEAVPVLNANLELVEPETRPALIRVIGKIGDRRSLLPLMRFVYDERGSIEESDARGLAMQAIVRMGAERNREQLFEFLLDIRDDEDPHVRGYAVEGFGRIGDARVEPFVEDALDDSDEFVRECARRAREALEDADSNALESTLDGRELLQKIRMADGSELDYYMNELLDREDAFELALQLVREEHRDTTRGLRAMMRLDDPRAREVARRRYQTTTSDATRAIALRLLADYLDGDADDEEIRLIEEALGDPDSFVSLAALEAAAKSGERSLVRAALEAVDSSDLGRAEDAARALAEGVSPDVVRILPELVDALERLRRHRRHGTDPTYITIEAYLLRAFRRLIAGEGLGDRDAQEQALKSLQDADDDRPILVTSLELLEASVPEEGLEALERWSAPEALPLVELMAHGDDEFARRALELVERAVSPEMPEISENASRLVYEEEQVLLDSVIPLLAKSGDEAARRALDELTNHASADVATRATDALADLADD